ERLDGRDTAYAQLDCGVGSRAEAIEPHSGRCRTLPRKYAISKLHFAHVGHDRCGIGLRHPHEDATLGNCDQQMLRRDYQFAGSVADLQRNGFRTLGGSLRNGAAPTTRESKRAVTQPLDLCATIAELQGNQIPVLGGAHQSSGLQPTRSQDQRGESQPHMSTRSLWISPVTRASLSSTNTFTSDRTPKAGR